MMLFPSVRRVFEYCRYNVSSNSYLLIYKGMDRRIECAIVEAYKLWLR